MDHTYTMQVIAPSVPSYHDSKLESTILSICRSAARNAQSEATFVLPLAKMEPSLSGSDEVSQPPHQPTNKTEIRQEFVNFE